MFATTFKMNVSAESLVPKTNQNCRTVGALYLTGKQIGGATYSGATLWSYFACRTTFGGDPRGQFVRKVAKNSATISVDLWTLTSIEYEVWCRFVRHLLRK